MKTIITFITVHNSVFLTAISGKTYFTICLEKAIKLTFVHEDFLIMFSEFFLVVHILHVLFYVHYLKSLGEHILCFIRVAFLEI